MPTSSTIQDEPGSLGTFFQLLPDWTPSKHPRFARFNILIKVSRGAVLEDSSRIELHLFRAGGQNLYMRTDALDPTLRRIQGPAWKRVSGRLLGVDDAVSQAEAVLGNARSARVYRREAKRPLVLVAVPYLIGVSGEPHFWWRFFNRTAAPIPVKHIFRTSVLWMDDRALRPQSPYNGPSLLPAGRALSGLWSLDDIEPSGARGRHRFTLEIFGERSSTIEPVWNREGT